MKLNARQVETAKPGEKDYKLPDGNGLILLVKTSGAKYWRYRYTFLQTGNTTGCRVFRMT
ncbi:DUF4102 domain-containing protein [Salmonella enterica]|nr:DUF4102 domain-containing protein [Salmonella enterica]